MPLSQIYRCFLLQTLCTLLTLLKKYFRYHGDTLVEWDPIRGNNAETIIGEKVVKRCANYRNMRTQYGPFVAVDVSEVR